VALDEVKSGGSTTVHADDGVSIANLTAGGSASLSAGGDVTLGEAVVGASLAVASSGGEITIGSAQSGGSQTLSGDTGVFFTSLNTTGIPGDAGNIDIASASGPIQGQTLTANGDLNANGASIVLGDVVAETGASLTSAGLVKVQSLFTNGGLAVDAAGAIEIGSLTASNITLTTPGALQLATVTAQSTIDLAAGEVLIGTLRQGPGPSGPLAMTLTGYKGGVGSTANVTVDAPVELIMPKLYENQATIDTNSYQVKVADANITGWLRLVTPYVNTWANDVLSRPVNGEDLQLFQPSNRFSFYEIGDNVTTTSFVVQYNATPLVYDDLINQNPDDTFGQIYVGASFVRDFDRIQRNGDPTMFTPLGQSGDDGAGPGAEALHNRTQETQPGVIFDSTSGAPAVNLDDTTAGGQAR
jgi:hypothetical protein